MTGPGDETSERLERRYRWLLRCYPASWRRQHETAMLAVLLDQADAAARSRVSAADVVDLVGHGAEARLDVVLRRLPDRLRNQVAAVALVVAAGLSLVMLVGEVLGARLRQPAEEISGYSLYFTSGPFLTIGVGLYLALMTAALFVVLGHGGPARLLVLCTVGYTVWRRWPVGSAGHLPVPRLLVLVLFAGLGVLAALATIRPSRRAARRMVGLGAAFVAAVAVGLMLSRPVLGWSIGTMATSGNVAFAALAAVLPGVGGAAVLIAALVNGRHPGWPSAIAVAAFPVVLFCTLTSQMVNPDRSAERALFPLYYVLVVTAVALVHHRGRRRSPATV